MITVTATYEIRRIERYSRPDGSADRVRLYLTPVPDQQAMVPMYERMLDVDASEERPTGTRYTVQETYTEVTA